MKELIARWPGKSPMEQGGINHPAVYHMLDVAAVAECLLRHFNLPTPHQHALLWLTALHDLGKIGAEFRDMILTGAMQGRDAFRKSGLLARIIPMIEEVLEAGELPRPDPPPEAVAPALPDATSGDAGHRG